MFSYLVVTASLWLPNSGALKEKGGKSTTWLELAPALSNIIRRLHHTNTRFFQCILVTARSDTTMAEVVTFRPYCHLLKLPTELRLAIWSYLYGEEQTFTLMVAAKLYCNTRTYDRNGPQIVRPAGAALLQTRKTFHAEAQPILYENTTFQLNFYPYQCVGRGPQVRRLGNVATRNHPTLKLIRKAKLLVSFRHHEDEGQELCTLRHLLHGLEHCARIKSLRIKLDTAPLDEWGHWDPDLVDEVFHTLSAIQCPRQPRVFVGCRGKDECFAFPKNEVYMDFMLAIGA